MTTKFLQNLNQAQQQAICCVNGPVLVLAGPGSGKTRVLTHRIAYMIEESGIKPQQILAVTFTNKAAREMKERLIPLIGDELTDHLTVGTFHSICTRFLRRDIVYLERKRDFTIYDSDDQERLMRQILKAYNIDVKQNPPFKILGMISHKKNGKMSSRIPLDNDFIRCSTRYQELLLESNALDFDDLLLETLRLFKEHPEVLERYHAHYTHLLVDEFQDTNHVQYELVNLLAAKHRNLFVVGDENQSIYSWRGADMQHILNFEEDYPDAQVILLEQNYRSTQNILDLAQAVIRRGKQHRHKKDLQATRGAGERVILFEAYDQHDEAHWVADEIRQLVNHGRYQLKDCAVMYRTNAQSRVLEDALIAMGLKYQIVGGVRFYERKEVKDILAYLRLLLNPFDRVSFLRVINVPPRDIGTSTISKLEQLAIDQGVSLFHALQELDEESHPSPFTKRQRNGLLNFFAIIRDLTEKSNHLNLPTLVEHLIAQVNFRDLLNKEYDEQEAEDRWNNVRELINVAHEYAVLPQETQLTAFLQDVALLSDQDRMKSDDNVITCITLHQAKGLEYPVVFLIGLEEGILPHNRSMANEADIEEERRLFYVGATRAKERLYLLYAFRRMSWGESTANTKSRFLRDIPPKLLHAPTKIGAKKPTPKARAGSTSSPSTTNRPNTRQKAGDIERSLLLSTKQKHNLEQTSNRHFSPGQRVRHANYGEGVVIKSQATTGDEEVTVQFDNGNVRHLLATFARLEKIEE